MRHGGCAWPVRRRFKLFSKFKKFASEPKLTSRPVPCWSSSKCWFNDRDRRKPLNATTKQQSSKVPKDRASGTIDGYWNGYDKLAPIESFPSSHSNVCLRHLFLAKFPHLQIHLAVIVFYTPIQLDFYNQFSIFSNAREKSDFFSSQHHLPPLSHSLFGLADRENRWASGNEPIELNTRW